MIERSVLPLALVLALIPTVSLVSTRQGTDGRAPDLQFAYDTRAPFDLKPSGAEQRSSASVRDVSYVGAAGTRIAAYLVEPVAGPRRSGVLFVHWVENEDPTSNRTEFLPDAVELAGRGVVSLLIDAMWADPHWFMARKHADDYAISVRQVKELRRATDLLFAQPGITKGRAAFVGHDFGAMYGTLMAGVEKRFGAWVLMTPTASFSDWFLYAPKIEGAAREQFIAEMAPLDPVKFVASIAPSPVLLQFGTRDPHVPKAKADAYAAAARDPKEVRWYEAGHALDERATRDRLAWLVAKLGL